MVYDLFVQLERLHPAQARRHAVRALPAILEAGDFARAERYLPDPLPELEFVNGLSAEFQLFPTERTAPRLSAELSNFLKIVGMSEATLRGLRRESEAQALRCTVLAGLATDEMRALAEREIASPGTITREVTAHRIAQG